MPETKSPDKAWYRSRGAWANGLTVLLGILTATGFVDIDGEARQVIISEGPELFVGLSEIILGGIGLWGRIAANTRLVWRLPFLG